MWANTYHLCICDGTEGFAIVALNIERQIESVVMLVFRVTDRYKLSQALVVDPLYLQHSYSESAIDYRVSFLFPSAFCQKCK